MGSGPEGPGKETAEMKEGTMSMIKILRRALLLCLCAALLCPAAFAEQADRAVALENTEWLEGFSGACVLPDGRIVFSGYQQRDAEGNSYNARGRLLCLNPDLTVAWKWTDPEVNYCSSVALTGENTLAVYCYETVKFFTTEGQPTGKTLSLSRADDETFTLTAAGLIRGRFADGEEGTAEFIDWDGNVLFRIGQPNSMWEGKEPIAEEDGLVLYGQGNSGEPAARIAKIDYQGNTVWQTDLPFLMEQRDFALADTCEKTADGGYLAALVEIADNYETQREAVVRLDADGRILWIRELDTEAWYRYVTELGGKTAAINLDSGDMTLRCLWLDGEGNELGTAERRITEDDYPPYARTGDMWLYIEKTVPAADGLWAEICFMQKDSLDEEVESPAWTPQDNMLIRIPEL